MRRRAGWWLRASLFMGATLGGCASPLQQHPPPADPPGTFVALTKPIIAVADTQEHESTGFPLHDNDGAVDAYVEVAQRAPEQPLFNRRIVEWAIQSHPEEPVIHLGDVLDMSCESEIGRMRKIFEAAKQPGATLRGNHDGLLFGIFNYNVLDPVLDPNATKWDRGCRPQELRRSRRAVTAVAESGQHRSRGYGSG